MVYKESKKKNLMQFLIWYAIIIYLIVKIINVIK